MKAEDLITRNTGTGSTGPQPTSRDLTDATRAKRNVRLVVAEDGSASVDELLLDQALKETLVIRQSDGESPLGLAQRTVGQLAMLERSQSSVESATLLVTPRIDPESTASRLLLARAFLMHAHAVPRTHERELVLAVTGEVEATLRHEFMALVETLLGEPENSAVPIRILFKEPATVSTSPVHKGSPWRKASLFSAS